MHKWWSLLFAALLAGGVGLFVVAAMVPGWWLPKNVSSFGAGNLNSVDGLFYLILAITGFFFVVTEAILVYFLWHYTSEPGQTPRQYDGALKPPAPLKGIISPLARLIHDQHRLELAWSIIPGAILVFIAVTQIRTWEHIKYYSQMPEPGKEATQMEVSARQFEWRVRYPSPERMAEWDKNPELARDFADNPHADDIWLVNEVHVIKQNKALVHLRTRDVIHSFFLPNLRLKQDALPGKTIKVWFKAEESNTNREGDRWIDGGGYDKEGNPKDRERVWELACAELCGWGHYKMTGKLYVHASKDDFMAWLKHAREDQFRTQPGSEEITTAAR